MTMQVVEFGDAYPITNASTSVGPQDGVIVGILVSSSSTGTLTITDRAGARTLCTALPLTAGQFVSFRMKFVGSLALTGGGTFAATLVVNG